MPPSPPSPHPIVKAAAVVVVVGAALVGVWAGSRSNRPRPEPAEAAVISEGGFLPAVDSVPASPSAARGEAVFEERCASCHTIGGGDREGPDLARAAVRRDPIWVSAMILAPDSMFRTDSLARWILDVHDVPEDATRDNPDLRALADFFGSVAPLPVRTSAPSPD
jgi:mono/diheme cytochrome c family protein